jgi:HK97 gp10 family phage protein
MSDKPISKAQQERDMKAQVADLKKTFQNIEFEIMDELTDVLEEVGLQVENSAKYFTPVDTGLLRRSITHRQGKDSKMVRYVEIGTSTEYAEHVEFGTMKQKAQPFLSKAYEKHKVNVLNKIKKAVQVGADQGAKK